MGGKRTRGPDATLLKFRKEERGAGIKRGFINTAVMRHEKKPSTVASPRAEQALKKFKPRV